MISFVTYFHSSRTENLRQTLKFLDSRENCEREVVLVCNDSCREKFLGCRLFNMKLSDYKKPLMCNFGVQQARGDIVALIDSDRIMPKGYFSSQEKSIKPGEFAACERMVRLSRPHSDEEIESQSLEGIEEVRSKGWDIWSKNLFSGNTVFYKNDYIESGGMDESFIGYGFADNDMSRNVITKGYAAKWTEATEIHLYHPAQVMESGSTVESSQFLKRSRANLCMFYKKWGDKKEFNKECGCLM
jgi:hypothetical protein